MNSFSLTQRYQNILRTTIQHYIATAEPVGSKTLVEEYNFSISSATIRAALGQLEKAGLLYQPHTSAGRIPSDDGYRIYVDQLITPDDKIRRSIEKKLNQHLQQQDSGLEALFQRATKILAHLSGYIALITLPQGLRQQLRHVQLVQVSSQQIMVIVVTDNYQTQSILMDLPKTMGRETLKSEETLAEELQILSNFLNSKLQGCYLSDLATLDWQEIDQSFSQYGDVLKSLLLQINRCLQPTVSRPMRVHGVAEMLRQPEFGQMQQVQMLLHLLEEEPDRLLPLIWESPDRNLDCRATVRIGAENPLESMRPCTLISSIYRQGDRPMGSVGVIGPTRMLYENAIALVESTADYLSEALS